MYVVYLVEDSHLQYFEKLKISFGNQRMRLLGNRLLKKPVS